MSAPINGANDVKPEDYAGKPNPMRLAEVTVKAVGQIAVTAASEYRSAAKEVRFAADGIARNLEELANQIEAEGEHQRQLVGEFVTRSVSVHETALGLLATMQGKVPPKAQTQTPPHEQIDKVVADLGVKFGANGNGNGGDAKSKTANKASVAEGPAPAK